MCKDFNWALIINSLLQSPIMDNIGTTEEYLEPTELGKVFQISAADMNIYLRNMGLQYKDGAAWCPTDHGQSIAANMHGARAENQDIT